MLSGGATDGGQNVVPLRDSRDRESAVQLCRQIGEFRDLAAQVLRDPATKGEGTTFDERYDEAFEQLLSRIRGLSASLPLAITADAVRLSRWGTTLAAAIGLIAVGVALLVSRHRRLLAAKSQQMAGLALIVESSLDAIVGKSLTGVITSWNSGAERLYGYGSAEIIGRNVEVLVPPERREEEAASMARVCRGEQVQRYETDRRRKDGSTVPVALTMSPIFEGNTVRAILCYRARHQ